MTCPLTTSSTITRHDGTPRQCRYRVRTVDTLARVSGPVELYESTPGEWFERDGPVLGRYVLTPEGWRNLETQTVHRDSIDAALETIKQIEVDE